MWPASVIPPSGYFFDEKGIRIEGANIPALVDALIKFRAASNTPPGDPLFEVHRQLCVRHPSLSTVLKDRKLAKAAVASIRKYLVQRRPNVSDEEARRRSEICLACPMRAEWSQHCGPCNASASEILKMFKGREIAQEKMACTIDGTELSLGVVYQSREKLAVAPHYCWRKA